MSNTVSTQIKTLLDAAFSPHHLDIQNESHMHNVPAGSELHFKVTLVSEKFNNLKRIQRHRIVNDALQSLINNPIHALSLHLYTFDEWQAKNQTSPNSPPCRGGLKKET